MSFTGLQNTFVPLSINGLSQTFSDTTEVGDLTCNSISIQGIKNPLLNFPISQDNITRFNGTYKLQYTDETTTVFTATNASITFGVALDLGNNSISTTGSITATDLIGNGLSIKNSSISTNKYLLDHDESNNVLNFNFLTSSTNNKIYTLDQYGNVNLYQGLYFLGGNFDKVIGNTNLSNMIFQVENTYRFKFVINNIERAYINQSGFWTDTGVNLLDSASGLFWTFQTSSSTRLGVNYNSGLIAYFDSSTGFNTGQINFTTSLNSITPTVFAYLSGTTSNIQSQINAITTSFINKTGTTSGVNCQINLLSGGFFLIGPGYFSVAETTGVTSCFRLSIGTTSSFGGLSTFSSGISTNLINTYNASYYDPTSSIQTQLDSCIKTTGNPTGVNLGLYLSTTGAFAVYQNAPLLAFSVTNLTGDTYIKNLNSSSQINSISASFYDPTSSIQTQLNNRITPAGTFTGVGLTLQLNTTSSNFLINGSGGALYALFCVNFTTAGDTFIKNIHSASFINGASAGYYDFTSSGQTQLNNRITKTGTTTGVNNILQLSASIGAFAIESSAGNTKMAIASENNFYLNGQSNARFIVSPTSVLYGSFIRNDGNTTLFMLTDINNVNGTWNSLRPFYIDNASGKIFSENGQQFLGGLNCDKIQFTADATIPNGFSTEIASGELLMNWQINFRDTNVAVNTARQGLFFRLDNRTGITPFQWYKRLAGSSTETQIMGLSINGELDVLALTNLNLTIPRVYTGDNTELVIRTGLNDSAPAGSYITLRTASSSLGVNFVNNGNTVNWGSFRSGGFDSNVPARLNNTTNSINAQKASNYNNYVLCQESVNGTVNVSDSQVVSLFANGNSWNTGYTFSSIFTKYTDGSICSFVGTVSCYAPLTGFVTIRVRFTDVTTGTNYDINQSFYFNVTYSHTTIGVSGQPTLPNGVYNVEFGIIAGVGTTDAGDTIKCLVILSPS
jgi:hypothetical protein